MGHRQTLPSKTCNNNNIPATWHMLRHMVAQHQVPATWYQRAAQHHGAAHQLPSSPPPMWRHAAPLACQQSTTAPLQRGAAQLTATRHHHHTTAHHVCCSCCHLTAMQHMSHITARCRKMPYATSDAARLTHQVHIATPAADSPSPALPTLQPPGSTAASSSPLQPAAVRKLCNQQITCHTTIIALLA
jgi:hypothetical protein